MTNPVPLSINEAMQKAHDIAAYRRRAEGEWREQIQKAAQAEADYRSNLAKAMIGLEGTAAHKEATARAAVSALSYDRDLQRDLVKVCQERVRGIDGERALFRQFAEWSMRIDTFLREDN